ncbi:hypothetical protein CBR_g45752 [Chara braunii]|uniref:Nuclear speckle splicing regulatory protein 1 N-terminal domain-containing protein n=1 Tax=Chara braunii TaxID=69332 RepID=A0A388LZ47_CHABU|nr:hypothetical protein CBR_g45752 [Chara braunii]|eukprot:GBG87600.1 hypothetical protein CBR_g45752 [Chara braunii]
MLGGSHNKVKYGLQLPVQKKKGKEEEGLKGKLSVPPPRVASIFSQDDHDEDDVEAEIERQASKKRAEKEIELLHAKALQENPLAFEYDAVYDEMTEKKMKPKTEEMVSQKPKYIGTLLEKAKRREMEQELVRERTLQKEREREEGMYEGKEKFVTSAYKKKLAEQAKWIEEEKRQEEREKADDVTKRKDLSDFYHNLLSKNVAFGGESTSVPRSPRTGRLSMSDCQKVGGAVGLAAPATTSVGTRQIECNERQDVPSSPSSGGERTRSRRRPGVREEDGDDDECVGEKARSAGALPSDDVGMLGAAHHRMRQETSPSKLMRREREEKVRRRGGETVEDEKQQASKADSRQSVDEHEDWSAHERREHQVEYRDKGSGGREGSIEAERPFLGYGGGKTARDEVEDGSDIPDREVGAAIAPERLTRSVEGNAMEAEGGGHHRGRETVAHKAAVSLADERQLSAEAVAAARERYLARKKMRKG